MNYKDLSEPLKELFSKYLDSYTHQIGKVYGVTKLEFTDDCFNESIPYEERDKMARNEAINYYLSNQNMITDHDLMLAVHAHEEKMNGYLDQAKEKKPMKTIDESTGKVSEDVLAHVEKSRRLSIIRRAIIDEVEKKHRLDVDVEGPLLEAFHEAMIKYHAVAE